jgi:hypothetical protein
MPLWLPLLMPCERRHQDSGHDLLRHVRAIVLRAVFWFDPAQDDGGLSENGPARLRYGLSTETPAVSSSANCFPPGLLVASDQRH